MGFWDRMQNVDRRIIYVLLAISVSWALIKPVGLAIDIQPSTQAVYDTIDALPAGSIIFMSADYGSTSLPELHPTTTCILRHALSKNLRIVAGGMWNEAGSLIDMAWTAIKADFPNVKYGTDLVNIGFRANQRIFLERLLTNVSEACGGVDHYGASLADMPLMAEFTSLSQAKLIYQAIAGAPGQEVMIPTVTDPYKIPYVAAVVSVSVANVQPFVQSGQMIEMVRGQGGAAQYEVLVKKPGGAVAGSDASSFAHVTIVAFMIFGNIGYILSGKKKARIGK